MKRILRSMYGRYVGTVDDLRLMAAAGLIAGDWGKQMPMADLSNYVVFDDFDGAALLGTWGVNKGSDGGCANFALNGGISGTVQGTTGAGAGATFAVNGISITAHLNLQAQTSVGAGATNPTNNLEFDCRVQLSAITNVAIFVGFTNATATGTFQIPINGAGGGNAFTKNANDAVGFLFDTTMTTADWWTIGVKGGTLTAGQDSGSGPTAATYDQFHVSVDQTGQATFFRNGLQVGVQIPNSVTANVALTPVIAAFARAAASRNVTADYIMASMNRV